MKRGGTELLAELLTEEAIPPGADDLPKGFDLPEGVYLPEG